MTLPIYGEDEVITFIRKRLASECILTDDTLLDVVEAIWDFYDEQGYTSLDNLGDDDEEEASDDVIADDLIGRFSDHMDRATLLTIIKAERDYEEDLDNAF